MNMTDFAFLWMIHVFTAQRTWSTIDGGKSLFLCFQNRGVCAQLFPLPQGGLATEWIKILQNVC